MRISAFRNRLQIDTSARDGITELLNGGNPFFWNGSALQFEIGLFRKETIVDDLDNFSEIKLEIKPLDDIDADALMSATVLPPDIEDEITAAEWEAGEEEHCHALFEFSGSEANLDLDGASEKNFWLVLAAKRLDGESITLGCSEVTVKEDGSSLTPSSAGTGVFRFNLGYGELKFDDLTWHRIDPVMLEGQYTLDIAQADSGQSADFNFSKWRYDAGLPQLQWPDNSWHAIQLHILQDGQYAMDVNQSAAGSADGDSSKWRVLLGFPEMQFPDSTWHRITRVVNEDQYSIDIEQTPTP